MSNLANSSTNSILSELFETRKNSTDILVQNSCILESVFSPIQNTCPISFTGEGFLETFMAAKSEVVSPICSNLPSTSGNFLVVLVLIFNFLAIQNSKDIKQPKPMHSSLVINVYEAPLSDNNSLSSSPTKSLSSTKVATLASESSILVKKDSDELSKAFNVSFCSIIFY